MSLLYLEELSTELVDGVRSFDETLEMGVQVVRHGFRVGRMAVSEDAVRLSLIALFQQELTRPYGGYYYCDGGLV